MRKMNYFKQATAFFILIICLLGTSNAQNRISSPYSRFGFGDLMLNQHSSMMPMGGIYNAYSSNLHINPFNPASYIGLDSMSFVFETGVSGISSTLKTQSLSQDADYLSLSNLLFGFQIKNWWKGSFGLIPYSSVGYQIIDKQTEPFIGNVNYQYEGKGGLNQLYIGNAFKIGKKLAVGFNTNLLFGSIERYKSVYFPDTSTLFNTRVTNTITVKSLTFNVGMQYKTPINNDYTLTFGATGQLPMSLNAHRDQLAYSFYESTSGLVYPIDTIESIQNEKGTIKLPAGFGVGFVIERNQHWLIGADFNYKSWSDYESFGIKDSLKDSWNIAVGGEIKPNPFSKNYFGRVTYRAGFRYNTTYLQIKNNQLNEFGISFGLGLPLRKSKSTVNLGVEFGKRGTTDNNLIEENFIRFTIGFSAYDIWFVKRKYD